MERDVVETNALESVVDAVASVIVGLEFKVNVDHRALQGHAFCTPLRGVRGRTVEDVQVRQVNARGLDQFFGIEEDVVVARAVGVGRVTNELQFGLVNGFGGVHDAVAVIVVLAGSVFVVVVPLGVDKTGVVRAVFVVINGHDGVVAGVDVAVLVDGVEGVSVVLEIQGDEVTAHVRQIDVGDGEGLVCPSVVVSVGTGITGVAEPVGIVVENLR